MGEACGRRESHSGDFLVLGGLFDGSLLTDDLLEALQPHVLRGLVPHARLAAVQQVQGVDVFQLRVLHPLVHHQVQQLVCCVVEHLVVLSEKRETAWSALGGLVGQIFICAEFHELVGFVQQRKLNKEQTFSC